MKNHIKSTKKANFRKIAFDFSLEKVNPFGITITFDFKKTDPPKEEPKAQPSFRQ